MNLGILSIIQFQEITVKVFFIGYSAIMIITYKIISFNGLFCYMDFA